MRRVLRKVVERDLNSLGDLSTLDDPAAVQEIIQGHRELCGQQQEQPPQPWWCVLWNQEDESDAYPFHLNRRWPNIVCF